ncbi:anti-sigma factor family protein [Candidatus Palauibacter sp.]|uniref:anti-sigma factor family protein n=1 Tax=Candidatus Palauibacter sp. TaxID=3101350 RepID=UPI003C6F2DB0
MERDTHEEHIDEWTLNRFADGELPAHSADRVRSHLHSCTACRREVQLIRALSAAIRDVPTPKPPDELFTELFPDKPKAAAVISLAAPRREVVAFSRVRILSAGACLLALIAAMFALTVRPDRAMAGSSTLSLEWEAPAALAFTYETVSPLAAEPALRARLRYWVPDSLRFAQTESSYGVVELSREAPGLFTGTVGLPPGTAYAVAVVEDLAGNYIDSDFGSFWEYLETDAEGRPTLAARRHQLLGVSDLSVARAAAVAEEAALQFPAQPEFWVRQMLFAQGAVPPESREAFLRQHAARLAELDRASREGNPGPVELDALHRYAALLDRPDLASHWSDQLVGRYPRHGAAALVRQQSIARSPATTRRKLEELEAIWAVTGAPTSAQVGLRFSIELADPTLTRKWLDRHASASVFRDLSYDTELAGDMMAVPALQPLAEAWILGRLADSRDELGPERPLDQSRQNFRGEAARHRARLHLYLARLLLARGQPTRAIDAAERSVGQTWSPEVFREAAEIHSAAGSERRAAELLALSLVDLIVTPRPSPNRDGLGLPEPSEAQLAVARETMRGRVMSTMLDEHVDLTARLRSASGEETTLRDFVGGRSVLVVHAFRPDFVPEDAVTLLDLNSEGLRAAGIQTLSIAERPSPGAQDWSGFASGFYRDVGYDVWDSLGAWRELQYFVLDSSGRLRHRGEDVEAALRISFVLSTQEVASSDAGLKRKEPNT